MPPRVLAVALLAAAWIALPGPAVRADGERDCHERVCVEIERRDGTAHFFGRNQRDVPATLELGFPVLDNMRASTRTPLLAVVPARSRTPLVSIGPADRTRDSRWRWQWRATPGVVDAEHDDRVRYALPWSRRETFQVTQGVGGEFSHRGKSWYSYDFAMPVGTDVHAARRGTVIRVVDHFARGGLDESLRSQANSIQVLHEDGTIARYVHLRHEGARVAVGDRVRRGERIGFSGNTGYSATPHLHFTVFTLDESLERQSLDVRFDDGTTDGVAPDTDDWLTGSAP